MYILLSAFSFAIMAVFVRAAGDLPAPQKALFRNLISFLYATVILLTARRKERELGQGKQEQPQRQHAWGSLILRAAFGTAGVIANFYAIDHLHLGEANSLNKLSPFFTILASALLLKERVKPYQLLSLIVAFGGAVLILQPGGSGSFRAAHLVAIFGAFAAGMAYTYVRKLGLAGERGSFIVMFFSAFSILALTPLVLWNYRPMTGRQLVFLLLAGVAASFGQLGVTEGYRHAPARAVSIYNYTQIPFAALLGLVLYSEYPPRLALLGYALIIISALFMFAWEQRAEKRS